MNLLYSVGIHPNREDRLMTTIKKLRSLARELAGEAWDYDRRQLRAQAHVRREAAIAVMNHADGIEHEDAIFAEPAEEIRPIPRRHCTGR